MDENETEDTLSPTNWYMYDSKNSDEFKQATLTKLVMETATWDCSAEDKKLCLCINGRKIVGDDGEC